MNRRTALATAGSTLVFAVAGCLGDGDDEVVGNDSESNSTEENDSETDDTDGNGSEYSIEDRTYEECHLISIEYEWLPEDVKQEVDAALDGGRYESDGLLFAEVVDPDRRISSSTGPPMTRSSKPMTGGGRLNSTKTRSFGHRSRGSSPSRTPASATTRYTSNWRATIRFSTKPWRRRGRGTRDGGDRRVRPVRVDRESAHRPRRDD
ncbi:hypothetical protein [Halalkalicoccus paucihalophilus]|uniref:hypothetical protein n=1 Tax=Halalkalicoccus paucihalophilus TaxID=1008153 RepID=UPI001B809536|nr:hypothetical protein [Halalkalicoccus paucihalophilus]